MNKNKLRTRIIEIALRPRALLVVWILLAMLSCLKQYGRDSYNNYKIFKGVFWHTVQEKPLFKEYPDEYFDTNHYGPFFSVIIAPAALLPDWLGLFLWDLFNVLLFYYAIMQLPLSGNLKLAIGWLVTNELWTSLVNQQSNPIIAAGILFSYIFVYKQKDQWATGLVVSGVLVKLYGIVGLVFFLFSKSKVKYIVSGLVWLALLIALPMLISSPQYILQSYVDWYNSLLAKDVLNQTSLYQDISLIGFVRRIFGFPALSSLYFIIPGGLLFLVACFKDRHFDKLGFQLLVLISVMIGINIFSSSSESSTYIIGFTAVCLWFMMHQRPFPKEVLYMMIFAFVLTSLGPTDLIPPVARLFIRQYSLKAVPCALVWFYVLWQMLTYSKQTKLREEFQIN